MISQKSKTKQILIYSDCDFFAGCENMIANILNSQLIRKNYLISFIHRKSQPYSAELKKRLNKYTDISTLNFPDLALGLFRNKFIYFPKFVNLFFRVFFFIPLFIYELLILYIVFKKRKPSILHLNNGGYPGSFSVRVAALAGRLANIPRIIMVVNNLPVPYKNPFRWLDYPLDFFVKNCVDLFITGSEFTHLSLKDTLHLDPKKVIFIHNGINLRKGTLSLRDKKKKLKLLNFRGTIFGVVALLVERKGHLILLRAVKDLIRNNHKTNINFLVLIEGLGPLEKNLKELVKNERLSKYVKFIGSEEHIVDFMKILDILILPSINSEDFPNVILEAMALKKPVIASNIAGTKEQILHNKTGLLVKPADFRGLSKAMQLFIEKKIDLKKMGMLGFNRFSSNFTAEVAVDNYYNLYNFLLRH